MRVPLTSIVSLTGAFVVLIETPTVAPRSKPGALICARPEMIPANPTGKMISAPCPPLRPGFVPPPGSEAPELIERFANAIRVTVLSWFAAPIPPGCRSAPSEVTRSK